MGFRSLLYQLARLMGDVDAVQKENVGRGVFRPESRKVTGRRLSNTFKHLPRLHK